MGALSLGTCRKVVVKRRNLPMNQLAVVQQVQESVQVLGLSLSTFPRLPSDCRELAVIPVL